MTENLDRFEPKWPQPPPGDTILDILEEKNLTLKEFAHRTGYTIKHVNRLIRGEATITGNTALVLDKVLGGSAEFWLSREANYRKTKRVLKKTKNRETRASDNSRKKQKFLSGDRRGGTPFFRIINPRVLASSKALF